MLTSELWIEREDFSGRPSQGLPPPHPSAHGRGRGAVAGSKARLKYGYVIECVGAEKDADGRVTAVLARVIPTPEWHPGRRQRQGQGRAHLGLGHRGVAAEVRLVRPPVHRDQPDAGGRDFLETLNPGEQEGGDGNGAPAWPRLAPRPLPVRAPWLLRG